ncbi:MAG: FAD-dependent oxidoreductase, partial [Archangium sp.]
MSLEHEQECDVFIIGAGLTGQCLARQLRLRHPDLRITVVDRKTTFTPAGMVEAAGEEFADYAVRVLKLGPYLQKHHVVCGGPRFFFDSEARDLPLEELSELGWRQPHPVPTYLLDQAAFEQHLAELNRRQGISILLGTRVLSADEAPIELDEERGHRVHTTAGTFRCRWLVDAGGRASPLARQLGLVEEQPADPVGACWGLFEGCHSLDELGTEAWRARVPHWGRFASSTFFMYRGYWIWLQPVTDTRVSIGVVYDRRRQSLSVRDGARLLAFLREHRAVSQVLGEDPRLVDFGAVEQVTRFAREQFSTRRWFLTGSAGTVVYPMFSAGSWVSAENNKLIGELIQADRAGDALRYKRLVPHFHIRVQSRFDKLTRLFASLNVCGSFDAWSTYVASRRLAYFNRIVPDAFEDHRILLKMGSAHDEDCSCRVNVLQGKFARLLTSATRLTEEFVAHLD